MAGNAAACVSFTRGFHPLDDLASLSISPGHVERGAGERSFYALRVRIRDEGSVRSQAVYLALGIRMDGTRQVLGLWIKQNGGARFWLPVMNELKGRCMQDCLTAVVMGLKGLPQAMRSAFPEAGVQTCIVHGMWRGPGLSSHPECREMARHMQAI